VTAADALTLELPTNT